MISQITYLCSYPFFPFFTVNADFRKPIDQLKKACSRCFGFSIVWGIGRSSSQSSSTGHNSRDHPAGKGDTVILGKPSGNKATLRPALLERSLFLAPGRLSPEHKAVMESFSVN